ncbi:MAG UNVERIFIED_CONTAM: hypothetical protein LVT10_10520 [Anaerolineae bacterium]|jgi:hypothetical protein
MGAYTSVTASEFNGFPKPPLHGIEQQLHLPSENLIEEGYEELLPKQISTVSAVQIK